MNNKRERESMAATHAVVFKESEDLEGKCEKVKGYDFNQGVNYSQLLESFHLTGFQASNLGDAFNLVNQMLDWRLANEEPANDCSEEERDPKFRESMRCKVFLSFTSSLISSGVRENVRYLVQHHMVDVVITTAGGIEEDLLKCFTPTFEGDFPLPADESPDNHCCKLKDWIFPIFNKMLEEQTAEKTLWTLSKLTDRLGREINDESSYLHWASKNNIPVFCTDFTDGSLQHMLNLHSVDKPGLIIDVMQDIRAMNGEAVHATPRKTGMISLGGVLPLHLTCNEKNVTEKWADYTVYINTAQASDGSDCGARPDKVVSVDEIRTPPKTVKVHCDATIAFPLLVVATFAAKREGASFKQNKESEIPRGKRRMIEGYDFNQGVNHSELLNSFVSTGFQASSLGNAFDVVNKMLDWRLADEELIDCSEEELDPQFRESTKCKVFLGFTSNLISSGVRDIVQYLVQHRMVDVIVTTTGGIEEDLIKCLAPTFKGDFSLPGDYLRDHGWNRTGNLLTGNDNYCKFNKWIIPIYNKMLEEQTSGNILWTPSKFIHRLGREINDETSYLNWASKVKF